MKQIGKLYGPRFVQLFLLCTALLLSACGSKSKLDGTYSDGASSFTFKSNGKMTMSTMGMERELNYEVDGNKIKIGVDQSGNSAFVFTLLDDGSIQGLMGAKLTKQKK